MQVGGGSVQGAGRKRRSQLHRSSWLSEFWEWTGGPGAVPASSRCPCRRRENAENMYYFSELALTLNEHEEGVAPTDSRLRPDQRLMEKGHWDEANTEKQRLEEKQRLSRRRRLEACSRGCGTEEGEAGLRGRERGYPGAGEQVPRRKGCPGGGKGKGRKEDPRDREGMWGEGGRKPCPGGGMGKPGEGGRVGKRPPVHQPTHCACPAEKEADVYMPLWFEKRLDPLTGETACMYKGGYWEAKERQDWHMCPNIF